MKILHGDCLEKLKELESNSIDTIITDPPYGLSFMGKHWDYDVPSLEIWKEALRVLKPGGTALIFAGSRTQHRMAVNVEDAGFILKDCIMWLYGSGFPKATDISKQLDKGHERKVVGENPNKRDAHKKSGMGFDDAIGKERLESMDITEPATPEAKQWNGWKSHGLKPAYEPILVAMKPNEGTYANNALKWGVSGLNIDGGRIEPTKEYSESKGNAKQKKQGDVYGFAKYDKLYTRAEPNSQGRFPANIILDEVAAEMLDEQSGVSVSSVRISEDKDLQKNTFSLGRNGTTPRGHNDKGGASRFFYVAKASKSERNAGCEGLEERGKVFNGQSDKPSESMKGVEKKFTTQPKSNHHPTVKPLKLMEYLCELTKTPTGGVVLDPFMGSGTTGVASINTGRDFIGIEREEEYIEIARARIENTKLKLF